MRAIKRSSWVLGGILVSLQLALFQLAPSDLKSPCLAGMLGLTTLAHAEDLAELTSTVEKGVLTLSPPQGHHFNDKAPASVAGGEAQKPLPFKLNSKNLSAELQANPAEQEVKVQVYVCDDANTYCKKKSQAVRVPAVSAADVRPDKKLPKLRRETEVYVDKASGFYVNNPKKAFELAAKKKLPLMIDFFGIWCPPCNHLEAMVLRSPEFMKKTGARFVKLKIDADEDQFNELKSRYKIQGLPTLVFTTPEGDEIFRLLGFHPLDEVLAKADAAYASKDEGYAQLEAKATGGNAEARYKAAKIALDRNEPAKALQWLAPLKELLKADHKESNDPRFADLYRAQLLVAQAASDKKAEREALEAWVKDFPDSVEAVENYPALAELQAAAGDTSGSRGSIEKAIILTNKLIAAGPRALKGTEYSPADLAESRAGLLEKQGDSARTKAAYLACAKAFHAEAVAEKSAFARGPKLEEAYCLGKAGEFAKSQAIYRDGIKRFPNEYTFYQGLAKLWLEAKAPQKALPEAKKALEYGYGNQRLKAMGTLVKAYENLSRPKLAIEAIDAELATPPAPDAAPGTIKLRERLRAKAEELRKLPAT